MTDFICEMDSAKGACQHIQKETQRQLPKLSGFHLPVGISDFKLVSSKYYYIDKTMLIKDLIDDRPMVSLFTRPFHFGKTLNMDMLRVFFERTDEDTSVYFKDTKIWACGSRYRDQQGKYPVIYITFSGFKCRMWDCAYHAIYQILREEVQRHSDLCNSDRISDYDKRYLENILHGVAGEIDTAMILSNLSRLLDLHYGRAPIIIIDEYDTPILQARAHGYYDRLTSFMRNLLVGGLKDNRHLSFGIMTGVFHVAQESIFSDLNCAFNSLLDTKYDSHFGFTPAEVQKITQYYGISEKYDEIFAWYGGYHLGESELLNPWSVIHYFNDGCKPKVFWPSSKYSDLIRILMSQATQDSHDKAMALAAGKTIVSYVDTKIKYNSADINSILLASGYLTATRSEPYGYGHMCELGIPNEELAFAFNSEMLGLLGSMD